MIFFTFFIFAIFSRKWTFWITDNAVALHCCEAHAKVNRKIENSTPCNIIIHEYLNLAHVITSWTSPTMQLLGRIGPAGASLQIGEYNTFCCPIFFFLSRAQVEPSHRFSRWMAQTTSFRPRTVLLGVWTMSDVIWGEICPKNSLKGTWIGSFKPKRQNLYIAISP